jgi:hypothetical protein
MKHLVAILLAAAACGGAKAKPESPLVKGAEVSPSCCCKTIPLTDEKDNTPEYAFNGRMYSSTQNGTCVDKIQCSAGGDDATGGATDMGAQPGTDTGGATDTGVPPPPDLPPSGG